MAVPPASTHATIVGRYALYGEIAHGGMATVHVGRLLGPAGFARTVAIKRLHPNFAKDPEFVSMFMDEARLAARIHHPNVVSIIDVVATRGELLLVMDYIPGDSLWRLLSVERKQRRRTSPAIVVKIVLDLLFGLHAAHEARNERGHLLGIVHRDVSPQNLLVGSDGVGHVIDFGVAKAAGRVQTTQDGQVKGKLAYMAPEQIASKPVDRRSDLYSVGAVLWESLAGRRLFEGREVELMYKVLEGLVQPPSTFAADIGPALDQVVMKALQRDPAQRFATALEMAEALERAHPPASTMQVARWVEAVGDLTLLERAQLVSEVESNSEVSSVDWVPDHAEAEFSQPGLAAPPPLVVGSGALVLPPGAGPEPSTQISSTVSSPYGTGPAHKSRWWIGAAIGGVFGLVAVTGVALIVLKPGHPSTSGNPAALQPPPAPVPLASASAADSEDSESSADAGAAAAPSAVLAANTDPSPDSGAPDSATPRKPGAKVRPGGQVPAGNDDTAKAKYGF